MDADISHNVVLTGEVVETFERDGTQIAKISLRMCHIEVPMVAVDSPHLGDTVHLAAIIPVNRIENPD